VLANDGQSENESQTYPEEDFSHLDGMVSYSLPLFCPLQCIFGARLTKCLQLLFCIAQDIAQKRPKMYIRKLELLWTYLHELGHLFIHFLNFEANGKAKHPHAGSPPNEDNRHFSNIWMGDIPKWKMVLVGRMRFTYVLILPIVNPSG
jgi:hypothetical protein